MADSWVAVVLAADDRFSRPLAVTVASVVARLSPGRGLTTAVKAWSYECTHPFRDQWFASLDQTPYRGWRPSRRAYLTAQARQLGQRVKEQLRPPSG